MGEPLSTLLDPSWLCKGTPFVLELGQRDGTIAWYYLYGIGTTSYSNDDGDGWVLRDAMRWVKGKRGVMKG